MAIKLMTVTAKCLVKIPEDATHYSGVINDFPTFYKLITETPKKTYLIWVRTEWVPYDHRRYPVWRIKKIGFPADKTAKTISKG